MKFLILAAAALVGVGAHAKGVNYSNLKKIQLYKGISAMNVVPLAVGDMQYSGQVAVGRLSPFSMTVELVGLTVKQAADGMTAARTVKVVVSLMPDDPADMEEAFNTLGTFFWAKTGLGWPVGEENSNGPIAVAKTIGVAFDPTAMDMNGDACMGADLESISQESAPDKTCHVVVPTAIIYSAL